MSAGRSAKRTSPLARTTATGSACTKARKRARSTNRGSGKATLPKGCVCPCACRCAVAAPCVVRRSTSRTDSASACSVSANSTGVVKAARAFTDATPCSTARRRSADNRSVQLRCTCVAVVVCAASSPLFHHRFCQRAASITVSCSGRVKCVSVLSVVRYPSSSSVSVAPLASISMTLPGSCGTACRVSSSSRSEPQQMHSPLSGVTSASSSPRRAASILAFSKSLSTMRTRSPRSSSSGMSVVRKRVLPAPRKPAIRSRGITGETWVR